FKVIKKVLKDLIILLENIYNINKIRVILYILSSIKVLISKDNPRDYKGVGVKYIIVTIIKYISINSRSLLLIII
ncbi:hypothetical protein V8E51_000041, partial [Hyaloscypha variabilis]